MKATGAMARFVFNETICKINASISSRMFIISEELQKNPIIAVFTFRLFMLCFVFLLLSSLNLT